ncbi:DUF6221 family protein [Streptomyces anulatus]|uniref:DUF6221 family protein n=1 Tax=Streptomyces anulatus TaxID=1892 RepID=UPI003444A872
MDDLVQFLRQRLDDDEQTARAAHAPNWSTDGRTGLYYGVEDSWMTDALTTTDADHIAHHDPTRVLREVDAKRSLLDLAERARDYHETFVNGFAAALENTLRLYALPHADHPDYQDDWRP